MAALDDLVEMDLATAQEEWQDFETGMEGGAPSLQLNNITGSTPQAIGTSESLPPLTGSAGHAAADDKADNIAPQPSAINSTTINAQPELDLLDLDAPVIEQRAMHSVTSSLPLDVHPVGEADNDDFTDFAGFPPPEEKPVAATSEFCTPEELGLL